MLVCKVFQKIMEIPIFYLLSSDFVYSDCTLVCALRSIIEYAQ